MADCHRCGAAISPADIQKGRALQRGEFVYCPDCVAEARAAKSGGGGGGSSTSGSRAPAASGSRPAPASALKAAPASAMKAAPASAMKAAPASAAKAAPASGMRPAPGSAMKAAPPSSKMKPAPSSASRPAAADKYGDLMGEEEGAAADAPAAPPPGSRIGKAAGGTSRMRRAPVQEEPEPPASSGSLRRPIGFKDDRGGIGKPMSKQSFMMWAVGGGAAFVVAVLLFFTLIVGKLSKEKEAKKREEQAKEYSQEVERIMREEPNNFDAMNEALEKLKSVAPGTKLAENTKEFEKAIGKRKSDFADKKAASEILNGVFSILGQPGSGDQALQQVRNAQKKVTNVGWFGDEQKQYQQLLLRVFKSAKEKAEAGKTGAAPDWNTIAGYYLLVAELVKLIPPDLLPADETQKVLKDVDEAIEKRYEDKAYIESLAWKELGGADTEWKGDEWLVVARGTDGVTLNYPAGGAEKSALYWLNQQVNWKDYVLEIEFTIETEAFQVYQRTQPGAPPGATHDLGMLVGQNFIKLGERSKAQFWVYGGRFAVQVGDTKARPGFCAPTGSKTGGISIRVPAGGKVTLHRVAVKVMAAEGDAPAEAPK